jgi:diguanylate cyclase (GGDEF)-like protein
MTSLPSLHDQSLLTAFLASVEVGIVSLNTDFTVDSWNQFMENHSGKSASDMVGTSLFSHFPEIDANWLIAKTEPVINLSSPSFIIWEQRPHLFKFLSARPITSGSEYMYQNVTIFPLHDENGAVVKMCMIVYDVTDQALAKIQAENLNNALSEISRVDGLTGLYNRRYWQERFDEVYKLEKRREQAVSAIMLDIDHFKKVNDTYGHQAGDKVIQSLAKVIQQSIRETDIAGRYGGEEFAIVLVGADADKAFIVAERMRLRAEANAVQHEDQTINFTISVGIAGFDKKHKSPMAWLEKADQALYEAKESGRNRVIISHLSD